MIIIMSRFDKKLHELSKDIKVPEGYEKRIEETLLKLPPEKEGEAASKNGFLRRRIIKIAICFVVIALCIGFIGVSSTNANFLDNFKKTIMNFFNIGEKDSEELGVQSKPNYSQAKPELLIELRESVIDRSSIYVLVKITAPTDLEFNDLVGFDYFAFSEGTNFDSNRLLGGAIDCKLLEVSDKKNEAIYIVSLSSAEEITDGTSISVCFKDMMEDPYGENPKMLVEGLWTLSFSADRTVTEQLEIEGTEDMVYEFLGDKAFVQRINVTALGLEFQSAISKEAYEKSSISYTRLDVRLNMMDGSEIKLMNRDMDEPEQVESSVVMYSDSEEEPYNIHKFEFEDALNIEYILGITIDDLYIPFKRFE